MKDLRILFAPAEDQAYLAEITYGDQRGVEVPFTPFLKENDYEDLRWYLEDYMDLPDGGALVRARRIEQSLTRWGRQLHDALFSAPENRALLRQLLDGPEPRELTLATQNPKLLQLPWELMADDAGNLAQRVSVRRQLETPETPEDITPRLAQLPLRILYIVSRPADAGFIDPRLTSKALFDALDPLGGNVRVDFCRPPTRDRMEKMLREGQQAGDPYGIVHFDGHGTFQPDDQMGVLYFEMPVGIRVSAIDRVAADTLGKILAKYTVPLVILEACRSATVGNAVSGSIAPRLIQAGVSSVVAMGHAVHVEATRLLLDCFYRELVRGTTIGQAMTEARKALDLTAARWLESGPNGRTFELRDWFLPHLYQSAEDEALVPPGAHAGTEGAVLPSFRGPAARDEPGAFPRPPQFGFRGRALELHALERLLRADRGIVLHAMGGMGKTALATEAAHWWTRSGLFHDGACFLSFEQFASADRVVQVLGTYLEGLKFDQRPADEQRRRAIELFQQKEVLMVWDNFESVLPQFNNAIHASPYTSDERRRLAELFRDLTTDPGRGRLLVTCRPRHTGLPSAQRYELLGLARADSLWLIASILRHDGLTLEDPRLSRERLDPLLNDLADHPLSLELVGPHLRTLTPEEIRVDFGKLLTQFQQEAPEGRNQSLLASLEFSRRHLSPASRKALPWLGLFSGGVFEQLLIDVSQLASEAWAPILRELEIIALLRVEDDFQVGERPFLRFHPTLAYAAADPALAQNPEIRHRFLGGYFVLRKTLYEGLNGSQSAAALDVLNREETNYRTAVLWALGDQQLPAAALLGETFRIYLERSGRLRERDVWVQWLTDALGGQDFTQEVAAYESQHAWTRSMQGDRKGAVDQLKDLIERLRHTTGFDPAFQLAAANTTLGRVLAHGGDSAQAIPILREAVGHWEVLVEKEGGQPWKELLTSTDHENTTTELGNLAATMGDLATALRSASQYDEALVVTESCIEIHTKLGNHREIAADEERYASIFRDAGRYAEAETHYDKALTAARQAGAQEAESTILQSQGHLAAKRNQLERASRLYQQALERFREADDQGSMMRTYNLLGVVDQKAGRLAEARAWYQKSRELALLLDHSILGATDQNTGVVWQLEGEAARKRGDELTARRCFEAARRFVEKSLTVWKVQENTARKAASWSQLAQIHLALGNLAAAKRHANKARRIRESLGLKEAWRDFDTLSEIAQARGDSAAAAESAKKRNDLLEELERSAGEGGGLLAQMFQALQALTVACGQAGFGDGSLGPGEEEVLAQLDAGPTPFPAFAAFLRQIAAGQPAAIPGGLPKKFRKWLEERVQGAS